MIPSKPSKFPINYPSPIMNKQEPMKLLNNKTKKSLKYKKMMIASTLIKSIINIL